MTLPFTSPILPMLAKRVDQLPEGDDWIFEPKWDGFRAILFNDRDELLIQSRDTKALNRYFPELVDALKQQLPTGCVLDGEIVIATGGGLDFDALQLRIHPAASRIKLLAKQTPSSIVLFDLLCESGEDLRTTQFEERRRRLQSLASGMKPPIHLTPATGDRTIAMDWFHRFEGAGLDGVMAKLRSGSYEADKRVMLKVKHERDCDCVVAGFRWHKKDPGASLGSLLLGLFDDAGTLHHVGVCASFTEKKRHELVDFLAPYRKNALAHHPWRNWADAAPEEGQRLPGGKSRWSQGKDLSWEPLRPELVVEVAYEHMQGARFRHMSQFRRWRPDRQPEQCTYAQLEVVPPQELNDIFRRDISREHISRERISRKDIRDTKGAS
jgi:ATP-dependent DNA ligase